MRAAMGRRAAGRRLVRVGLGSGALLATAGCSKVSSSTLDPHGPRAATVATSWWLLFGVAATVCVIVIALVVLAAVVRRRRQPTTGDAKTFVMVCGIILPALILASTFALAVRDLATSADPTSPARTTIDVIGHRWWWEVRYPNGAVTANEVHVPVGQPVRLRLTTADVIHSFWVPELMPKTDLIPRRVNETWLSVDRPGTYIGRCAEYCGLQHAHMGFQVIAQSPATYDAWRAAQAKDAAQPTTTDGQRGLDEFTTSSCATCHTVRGTSADGRVGPDLTHVGSRRRLAAGAIPNNFGNMAGWVANSQTIKPGNRMPPQKLSPDDLRAVVAYLQGLK